MQRRYYYKKVAKFSEMRKTLVLVLLIVLLIISGCFGEVKRTDEVRIKEIKFKGNNSISDKKLKGLFPIREGDPYIERFTREGTERIINYYRSKGFFDMRIIKREGEFLKEQGEIIMTYHIFEGFRSKIDSIEIQGNSLFTNKQVRRILSIKEGDYYDEAIIGAGEYSLSNKYAESGYANVEIRVNRTFQDISASSKRVFLIIEVNEGNKVWVRYIKFKGLKGVRESIVTREMRIKRGDLYRPFRVYESQSRLYKTELFSDVDFHEQKIEGDSVDLTFLFKEEKPRFIYVGFGYESPSKGMFLFRWGHLNLFGNLQRMVIDFTIRANPELEHWENIRLTYSESYLFNTGFNLIASPAYFHAYTNEYEESDISFDLAIERALSLRSKLSLLYDFRRAEIQETPSITNRLSIRYLYEGRDNIIVPRKGMRVLSQIEYAGGFLGGDNHFDRFRLDISTYHSLPFRIVFAFRSVVGLTHPREAPTDISTDVRFEMGGYGTIRGYEEASIGVQDNRGRSSGLEQIIFNFELRLPIYKNVIASIFADVGNLWMDYSDISLYDPRIGVGFGLGYITPIGVVRFDYARALENMGPDYRGILYLNFANPF